MDLSPSKVSITVETVLGSAFHLEATSKNPHVSESESGVTEGIAERIDGRVDVAEEVRNREDVVGDRVGEESFPTNNN